MAVVKILEEKIDSRKGGEDCLFNGYLEDYVSDIDSLEIDETLKEILKEISEEDNQAKVCVNLKISVNKEAISNQIIRYKDMFKLEGKTLEIPFLIYGHKNGVDRAMILLPYNTYGYLYAKGVYYCMTEPASEFTSCRNELVSVCSDNKKLILNTYKRLYSSTAGSLQRSVDGKRFADYELLKIDAIRASDHLINISSDLLKGVEDKYHIIKDLIVKWFLLKKVLYVQYMINKDMLNNVHNGSLRKQRNQAKINSDDIKFISYSELWRKN